MTISIRYAAFFVITLFASSVQAFDSSGLGDPVCFHFYLSGVNVTKAKAVSKNRRDYHVTGSGRAAVAGCPFTFGPYTAGVSATCDAVTGEATEQISHGSPGSPNHIVTHVRAKCPKDPWQNDVSCSLIYQSNTHPGSALSSFDFAGPFPVTAGLLSTAQRKNLASGVMPYQDFVLSPNTPPVIVSPGSDVILRNGMPVTIQIKRPSDGSESWYAGRALQFEVQFEVNKDASVSAKGIAAALGPTWIRISPMLLIGTSTLTPIPVTVPLATFSSKGTGKAGEWQSWRMRARLSDPVVNRPWSNWQSFIVVVPTTFTKMPGGVELPSAIQKTKPSALKKEGEPPVAPNATIESSRTNQPQLRRVPSR